MNLINLSGRKNLPYFFFIILYVLLLTLQIHQKPFERYPEWDHFFIDVQAAGKLISLKHALEYHEIPAIDPYTEFGWNLAGDHHSIWGILNPFVLFSSPANILILQQVIFLFLGGWGAFLYLLFITRNRYLSFLGGIIYISLPFSVSLLYYCSSFSDPMLIPLFLIIIHRIWENPTRGRILIFALTSAISIGLADINFLWILSSVVFAYTFFVGISYYKKPVIRAFNIALFLVFLSLLSGSFYLAPLISNLYTIGSGLTGLKQASILSLNYLGRNVDFLSYFVRHQGLESLYLPVEGPAFILYLPASFYLIILITYVFKKVVFKTKPEQVSIVLTLVFIGFLMFCESLLFYSPLTAKILPRIREGATGVLRFQINLIPFVSLLAAFICISAINILNSKRIRIGIYSIVIVGSLLIDLEFFSGMPTSLSRPYGSSNLIHIPVGNPLHLIPYINLFIILLLGFDCIIKGVKNSKAKSYIYAVGLVLVFIVPFLGISNYNECFATGEGGPQIPLARNPYRWTSYLERKECIDKTIPRYNPNYRTLYVGKGRIVPENGKDWMLIAETELHVSNREKAIFSYREFDHPFVGLLSRTFKLGETGSHYAKINPPLSRDVAGNINTLKLMGVRWVISAEEEILSPNLVSRGKCLSAEGPRGQEGTDQEGGNLYIYELRNPEGISFLVEKYQRKDYATSLRTILEKQSFPWINDTVYLEIDPIQIEPPGGGKNTPDRVTQESYARIVSETFSSVEVEVSAPVEKFLVLGNLYRPFWKAYINSHETKIYRAYGGFMCVKMPTGKNLVHFKYFPVDIYLGWALTLVALIIPFLKIGGKKTF